MEALVFLFVGMVAGIVTGLVPGLHPNSIIFLSLPVYFAYSPAALVFLSFVTGMSVVHTFVSFIPSVLVGAPEGETALSVLPGHEYLLRGRGHEAIRLSVIGGVSASAFAVLLLPLLFYTIPTIYGFLYDYMSVLLLGILVFLVAKEENKIGALLVVSFSGLLGLLVLDSGIANSQYILFPLFAGLFGFSTGVISLLERTEIPEQVVLPGPGVDLGTSVKGGLLGFVGGVLAGFLPGFGSSQSALVISELGEINLRDFMITLGGITTADLLLSVVALYLIGNPRSGAAVVVGQVVGSFDLSLLSMIVGWSMVAIGIGALATVNISRFVVVRAGSVDYARIVSFVLVFLVIGSFVLSGPFGVLVLLVGASIGVFATTGGVKRSLCMSSLIVPTILYYSGIGLGFLFL